MNECPFCGVLVNEFDFTCPECGSIIISEEAAKIQAMNDLEMNFEDFEI